MHFPHTIFQSAGLNSTDVANLFGVSRITGYRWLLGTSRSGNAGVGVNIFLRDKVNKMAPLVKRAVDAGALPNPDVMQLPPTKRAAKLRSIINAHRSSK